MMKLLLPNKTYDTLVYVAQYVLPGFGAFYGALATIWGLPYGAEIVSTAAALDIFLGVLLGISNAQYKKTL